MKCPQCDSEFENETGMKIHHKKVHGKSLAGFKKNCAWCGTTVTKEKSIFDKAFCSNNCRDKWQSENFKGKNNPNYGDKKITLECKKCSKKFERWDSQENRSNYCSKECVYEDNQRKTGEEHPKWNKKTLECEICKEEYKVTQFRSETSKFCSRKCQGEWISQKWTGENHPRWVEGQTDYYGEDWRNKRTQTLERDNYKCQNCGREEHLHVHHIQARHTFKKVEDSNFLENLIVLCRSCHPKAEAGKIQVET